MGLPVKVSPGFAFADDELGLQITLLSSQINIANHRLLKLIAEFDVRGGWRCNGAMRSCAHWLAANCGMVIGAAREKVRVARALAGLPEVEGAFASGELSYSKVRAITRVATPANEHLLMKMAERASASHLEALVARYQPVDEPGLELLDDAVAGGAGGNLADDALAGGQGEGAGPTAVDEDARREQGRELFWFQDEDGMWVIHGRLPPEQGQLVIKALEAVARPIQEERQDAWKEKQKLRLKEAAQNIIRRHREAGVADCAYRAGSAGRAESADGAGAVGGAGILGGAGVEAAAGAADAGGAASSGATVPLSVQVERAQEKISAETFSQFMNQVRADAFAGMAEHFLATAGDYPQLQGLTGSERCQVVLHVDINTLREQRAGVCCAHQKSHFEDKPWLSPRTARRLGCDASLVTVLEDGGGQVLNVGRRSRIVPAHIRRALLERDGVCRYPGCHESRYVDAHHIHHWVDGGETSLRNLVVLCRFHHRQLHRGCFEIQLEENSAEIGDRGPGVVFRDKYGGRIRELTVPIRSG